jgi:mycothiol synthase
MRASGGLITLTWRAIYGSDVVAWAELLAAAETVDLTGEHYSADDLAEELADPLLDVASDTIAAFHGERMVAYGVVRAKAPAGVHRTNGVYRVYADGCVHPEFRRRGIGTELMRRCAVRGARLHASQAPRLAAELVVHANDRNAGVRALAESAGLHPVRRWYEMDRDLTDLGEPVPVPEGLRLAAWEPAIDERLRAAHNEAFAGNWGTFERDSTYWKQWVSGATAFRPALSLLLWDGDQIAGYQLVYEFEADTAATGVRTAWIGQVGTRPPWRGRGVASTLLTHVLATCRVHGYQRAALSVDTGNSTGALGIYERAGFAVVNCVTSYGCPIQGRNAGTLAPTEPSAN